MADYWWRAYQSALHHPKLLMLPDRLHRAWFNLMCVASKYGGVLPDIKTVSVEMRCTKVKAAEHITALVVAGLFDKTETDTFIPHNWNERQFQSDVSTPRVKRFRQRKRNVSVTPPDTDNRSSEAKASAPAGAGALIPDDIEVVGEDPKAKLFRVGKTILVSFGVTEKRTGALIGQWLKQKPDPVGVLAALQFARNNNVAEPIAYVSTLVNTQGNTNGRNGPSNLADRALELADQARRLESEGGLGGTDAAFGRSRPS